MMALSYCTEPSPRHLRVDQMGGAIRDKFGDDCNCLAKGAVPPEELSPCSRPKLSGELIIRGD